MSTISEIRWIEGNGDVQKLKTCGHNGLKETVSMPSGSKRG